MHAYDLLAVCTWCVAFANAYVSVPTQSPAAVASPTPSPDATVLRTCLLALPSPLPLPLPQASPSACPATTEASSSPGPFVLSETFGCCPGGTTAVVTDEVCRLASDYLSGAYCYAEEGRGEASSSIVPLWSTKYYDLSTGLLSTSAYLSSSADSHNRLCTGYGYSWDAYRCGSCLGLAAQHALGEYERPCDTPRFPTMPGYRYTLYSPSNEALLLPTTSSYGNMAVSGNGLVRAQQYRELRYSPENGFVVTERVLLYSKKQHFLLGGGPSVIPAEKFSAGETCAARNLPAPTSDDCSKLAATMGLMFLRDYGNNIPGGCHFVHRADGTQLVKFHTWTHLTHPQGWCDPNHYSYNSCQAYKNDVKWWGCGGQQMSTTGTCESQSSLANHPYQSARNSIISVTSSNDCADYASDVGVQTGVFRTGGLCVYRNPAGTNHNAHSFQFLFPDEILPTDQYVCKHMDFSRPIAIFEETGPCEEDPKYYAFGTSHSSKPRLCHFGYSMSLNHEGDVLAIGSPKKSVDCPGWVSDPAVPSHLLNKCTGSVRVFTDNGLGGYVLDEEFESQRSGPIAGTSDNANARVRNWKTLACPRHDLGLNVGVAGTKDIIILAMYGRFAECDGPGDLSDWRDWPDQVTEETSLQQDTDTDGMTLLFVKDKSGYLMNPPSMPSQQFDHDNRDPGMTASVDRYLRIYASPFSSDYSHKPVGYGETCLAINLDAGGRGTISSDNPPSVLITGTLVMGTAKRANLQTWPIPQQSDTETGLANVLSVAFRLGTYPTKDFAQIVSKNNFLQPAESEALFSSSFGSNGWGEQCSISGDGSTIAIGTYTRVHVYALEDNYPIQTVEVEIEDSMKTNGLGRLYRWPQLAQMPNHNLMVPVQPSLSKDGMSLAVFIRDFYYDQVSIPAHGGGVPGSPEPQGHMYSVVQVWDLATTTKPTMTHEMFFTPGLFEAANRNSMITSGVGLALRHVSEPRYYVNYPHSSQPSDLVLYIGTDGRDQTKFDRGFHDYEFYDVVNRGHLELWPADVVVAWEEIESSAEKAGAGIIGCFYDTLSERAFFDASGSIAADEGFSTVCVNSTWDEGYVLEDEIEIPEFCYTAHSKAIRSRDVNRPSFGPAPRTCFNLRAGTKCSDYAEYYLSYYRYADGYAFFHTLAPGPNSWVLPCQQHPFYPEKCLSTSRIRYDCRNLEEGASLAPYPPPFPPSSPPVPTHCGSQECYIAMGAKNSAGYTCLARYTYLVETSSDACATLYCEDTVGATCSYTTTETTVAGPCADYCTVCACDLTGAELSPAPPAAPGLPSPSPQIEASFFCSKGKSKCEEGFEVALEEECPSARLTESDMTMGIVEDCGLCACQTRCGQESLCDTYVSPGSIHTIIWATTMTGTSLIPGGTVTTFSYGDTVTATSDDEVFLNWLGGHNVYRSDGACPSSIGGFQIAQPLFDQHPNDGRVSFDITPENAGTYCFACITHYDTMHFTLTMSDGRRKLQEVIGVEDRQYYHYDNTDGVARQGGVAKVDCPFQDPPIVKTSVESQRLLCLAYDPSFVGAGANWNGDWHQCNWYGMAPCRTATSDHAAAFRLVDFAPYNPCNNYYDASMLVDPNHAIPPVTTIAQGLLRRDRYEIDKAAGTIRLKPMSERHLTSFFKDANGVYQWMYAPRQAIRGLAPGWIVNRTKGRGASDVRGAWCPHEAFCPRVRDAPISETREVRAVFSIPQYHNQHEVCVNTRLFDENDGACIKAMADKIFYCSGLTENQNLLNDDDCGGPRQGDGATRVYSDVTAETLFDLARRAGSCPGISGIEPEQSDAFCYTVAHHSQNGASFFLNETKASVRKAATTMFGLTFNRRGSTGVELISIPCASSNPDDPLEYDCEDIWKVRIGNVRDEANEILQEGYTLWQLLGVGADNAHKISLQVISVGSSIVGFDIAPGRRLQDAAGLLSGGLGALLPPIPPLTCSSTYVAEAPDTNVTQCPDDFVSEMTTTKYLHTWGNKQIALKMGDSLIDDTLLAQSGNALQTHLEFSPFLSGAAGVAGFADTISQQDVRVASIGMRRVQSQPADASNLELQLEERIDVRIVGQSFSRSLVQLDYNELSANYPLATSQRMISATDPILPANFGYSQAMDAWGDFLLVGIPTAQMTNSESVSNGAVVLYRLPASGSGSPASVSFIHMDAQAFDMGLKVAMNANSSARRVFAYYYKTSDTESGTGVFDVYEAVGDSYVRIHSQPSLPGEHGIGETCLAISDDGQTIVAGTADRATIDLRGNVLTGANLKTAKIKIFERNSDSYELTNTILANETLVTEAQTYNYASSNGGSIGWGVQCAINADASVIAVGVHHGVQLIRRGADGTYGTPDSFLSIVELPTATDFKARFAASVDDRFERKDSEELNPMPVSLRTGDDGVEALAVFVRGYYTRFDSAVLIFEKPVCDVSHRVVWDMNLGGAVQTGGTLEVGPKDTLALDWSSTSTSAAMPMEQASGACPKQQTDNGTLRLDAEALNTGAATRVYDGVEYAYTSYTQQGVAISRDGTTMAIAYLVPPFSPAAAARKVSRDAGRRNPAFSYAYESTWEEVKPASTETIHIYTKKEGNWSTTQVLDLFELASQAETAGVPGAGPLTDTRTSGRLEQLVVLGNSGDYDVNDDGTPHDRSIYIPYRAYTELAFGDNFMAVSDDGSVMAVGARAVRNDGVDTYRSGVLFVLRRKNDGTYDPEFVVQGGDDTMHQITHVALSGNGLRLAVVGHQKNADRRPNPRVRSGHDPVIVVYTYADGQWVKGPVDSEVSRTSAIVGLGQHCLTFSHDGSVLVAGAYWDQNVPVADPSESSSSYTYDYSYSYSSESPPPSPPLPPQIPTQAREFLRFYHMDTQHSFAKQYDRTVNLDAQDLVNGGSGFGGSCAMTSAGTRVVASTFKKLVVMDTDDNGEFGAYYTTTDLPVGEYVQQPFDQLKFQEYRYDYEPPAPIYDDPIQHGDPDHPEFPTVAISANGGHVAVRDSHYFGEMEGAVHLFASSGDAGYQTAGLLRASQYQMNAQHLQTMDKSRFGGELLHANGLGGSVLSFAADAADNDRTVLVAEMRGRPAIDVVWAGVPRESPDVAGLHYPDPETGIQEFSVSNGGYVYDAASDEEQSRGYFFAVKNTTNNLVGAWIVDLDVFKSWTDVPITNTGDYSGLANVPDENGLYCFRIRNPDASTAMFQVRVVTDDAACDYEKIEEVRSETSQFHVANRFVRDRTSGGEMSLTLLGGLGAEKYRAFIGTDGLAQASVTGENHYPMQGVFVVNAPEEEGGLCEDADPPVAALTSSGFTCDSVIAAGYCTFGAHDGFVTDAFLEQMKTIYGCCGSCTAQDMLIRPQLYSEDKVDPRKVVWSSPIYGDATPNSVMSLPTNAELQIASREGRFDFFYDPIYRMAGECPLHTDMLPTRFTSPGYEPEHPRSEASPHGVVRLNENLTGATRVVPFG